MVWNGGVCILSMDNLLVLQLMTVFRLFSHSNNLSNTPSKLVNGLSEPSKGITSGIQSSKDRSNLKNREKQNGNGNGNVIHNKANGDSSQSVLIGQQRDEIHKSKVEVFYDITSK